MLAIVIVKFFFFTSVSDVRVLGGVVCFVIGVLTGYCKWGKLRKYSAKRKQG